MPCHRYLCCRTSPPPPLVNCAFDRSFVVTTTSPVWTIPAALGLALPSPLLKGSSCLQVPIQWKSESRLKPDWPTILSRTNLKTRNTNYPLRSPPAANGLVTNALLCSFTVCRSLRSRRRSIHLLVYSVDNKLRTCIYGQHQLRTLGLQWRAGSGTGHWLTSPRATGRLLPLLLPPPPLALLLLGGQV